VTKKRLVALPPEICAQLGIEPGVRLDFRARKGKLEAIKLPPLAPGVSAGRLKSLYTAERNAEELVVQQGCSCEVPADFPP
jgi:bifunctional DNA-binding transcriptional regulator/antitoxin component of YhaV-PrlF toxin-antitoxin module